MHRLQSRIPLRWAPAAGLALAAAFVAAAARPPAEPVIAIVDTSMVIAKSVSIQTAIAAAARPAEELKARFEAKGAELKAARESLEAQRSVLSSEEAARRQAQIEALNDEVENLRFQTGREIEKAREASVNQMRERVVKTIGEIGREKGVTAVLGADHAIYYDAAADLTAAVIARLDAK